MVTHLNYTDTQNCPKHEKLQLLECQTAFLPLPLPATKSALFLVLV